MLWLGARFHVELEESTNLICITQDRGTEQKVWISLGDFLKISEYLDETIDSRLEASKAKDSWEF